MQRRRRRRPSSSAGTLANECRQVREGKIRGVSGISKRPQIIEQTGPELVNEKSSAASFVEVGACMYGAICMDEQL